LYVWEADRSKYLKSKITHIFGVRILFKNYNEIYI